MSESGQENGWGGGQAPPVILPPQTFEPAPQPRRARPLWASAPATYVLGGINCLVFVLMCVTGVSLTSPTGGQLLFWGADFGPSVLVDETLDHVVEQDEQVWQSDRSRHRDEKRRDDYDYPDVEESDIKVDYRDSILPTITEEQQLYRTKKSGKSLESRLRARKIGNSLSS